MPNPILKHFDYDINEDHSSLTEFLFDTAQEANDTLPECPEKSAGLRKLLEAKDCFARAEKENEQNTPS